MCDSYGHKRLGQRVNGALSLYPLTAAQARRSLRLENPRIRHCIPRRLRMVPLTALWLPILLSAVIVFVASSIMHMLLPYHRSDYQRLPEEDKLLAALRAAGLKRGLYIFPFGTHKEMKSRALIEKYKQGPVGMMTVFPSGPPVMPKFLGMWFVYCLIIGFFVAYLTGRTVAPGAHYLAVFRVAGTAAFLAYGLGH